MIWRDLRLSYSETTQTIWLTLFFKIGQNTNVVGSGTEPVGCGSAPDVKQNKKTTIQLITKVGTYLIGGINTILN